MLPLLLLGLGLLAVAASDNAIETTPIVASLDLGFDDPFSMAVGDLKGDDGVPDVAITSRNSNSVSVVSLGEGNAVTPVSTDTVGPSGIDVCDVDNDSSLDIVVAARYENAIVAFLDGGAGGTVELANAAGDPVSVHCLGDDIAYTGYGSADLIVAFGPAPWPTNITVAHYATTSQPRIVRSADFDGDGALDLVVAQRTADLVNVYAGDGSGGFAALQSLPVTNPRWPHAADLDGDGDLDLLVGCSANSGVVLAPNVDGVLQTPAHIDGGNATWQALSVDAGDVDLDGDVDVVVAAWEGTALLRNRGLGDMTFALEWLARADQTREVALFDADGDGDLDVASLSTVLDVLEVETAPFAPTALRVAAVEMDGSVSLAWDAPGSDNGAAVTSYTVFAANVNVSTVTETSANVAGLAVNAAFNFTVAATNARGTGPASDPVHATAAPAVEVVFDELGPHSLVSASAMCVADLNADGRDDFVATGYNSGSVAWFDVFAGSVTDLPLAPAQPGSVVCDQDFNGDGFLDVAVSARSTDTVLVLLTTGAGAAQFAAAPVVFSAPQDAGPRDMAGGDFDEDGYGDVAVALLDGDGIGLVFGGPTLANASITEYALPLGSSSVANAPTTPAVADFDGDGHLDLAFSGSSSLLGQWYKGDGSGSFAATQTIDLAASSGCVHAEAGDLNGDGRPDVAFVCHADNFMRLWLFDDTGFSTSFVTVATGTGPKSCRFADLDLDGDLDIVVPVYAGAAVLAHANDGSEGFSGPFTLDDSRNAFDVALGDADGDGDVDIGFCDFSSTVAWLEVRTAPFAPGAVRATAEIDGSITLSWSAPADDNGAPVTSYTLTNGQTTSETSANVAGLTLGATYAFGVAATSYRGTGPFSANASATASTPVEAVVTALPLTVDEPRGICTADLSGDGVPDIVVAATVSDSVSWIDVFADDGVQHFLSETVVGAIDVAAGDVGLDGTVDIVAGSPTNREFYVWTNGAQTVVDNVNATTAVVLPDTGDVVFGLNVGTVVHWLHWSTGVVSDMHRSIDGVTPMDTADFDDDGWSDVVVPARYGNGVVHFAGNGSGLAQTQRIFANAPIIVRAGDIDGDGDADAVFTDYAAHTVCLLRNDGTGVLGPVETIDSLDSPHGLALVDLDVDGDLDVVVTSISGTAGVGGVYWLAANSPEGDFSEPLQLASTGYAWNVVAGDFDQDGDPDLAVTDTVADAVYLLEVLTVPAAPTNVQAVAEMDGSVTVSWEAPLSSEDVPVTAYIVDGTLNTTTTSVVVTDLPRGTPHTVTVAAVNYRGTGPAAEAAPVVPTTPVEVVVHEAALDGLVEPKGVAIGDGALFVGAAGSHELAAVDVETGAKSTISAAAFGVSAVAAADLNSDGLVDVVAACPDDDELQFFFALGGGAFSNADDDTVALPVGGNPLSLRVLDVTGDGFVDMVASLYGTGDVVYVPGPDFNASHMVTVATGLSGPTSFDVGDIDGDGLLDLVVPEYTDKQIVWFSAFGGATQTLSLGATQQGAMSAARIGDVTGDGHPDVLVAANGDSTVVMAENNKAGFLQPLTTVGSGIAGVLPLQLADLDWDGDVDIVVGAYDGDEVAWLANLGDGSFSEPITLLAGFDGVYELALADLDADGDLDVAATAADAGRLVWLEVLTVPSAPTALQARSEADGSVTLTWEAPAVDNGADVTLYVVSGPANATNTSTTSINIGDLVPETAYNFSVAAANYRGTGPAATVEAVSVVPVEAGATTLLPTAADYLNSIVAADISGDGVDDLLFVGSDSYTVVWRDTSDGVEHVLDTGVQPMRAQAADINGDGLLDVVAAMLNDEARVYFNPFDDAPVVITFGDDSGPRYATAADMDNDGEVDLLVALGEGDTIAIVPGPIAADGVVPLTDTGLAVDLPVEFALVDFDSDGLLDVIAPAFGAHAVNRFRNLGGHSFTQEQSFGGLHRAVDVKCADLDGDGDEDCVVCARDADALYVMINQGAGALDNPVLLSASLLDGVDALALADLDFDGDIDVVAAARYTETAVFYANDGSGSFGPAVTLLSDFEVPIALALADLDQDGDLDLAVTSLTEMAIAFVEILTVPMAPTAVVAEADMYGGITLSWSAPVYDNGAAVTEYSVEDWTTTTTTTTATSVYLSGLALGTTYSFAVRARSSRGLGPAAAAASATSTTPVEAGAVTTVSEFLIDKPKAVKSGDVDNDGVEDFVVSVTDSGYVLWYDMGEGAAEGMVESDAEGARGLDVGDLNGDGKLDVVVAAAANDAIGLILGNGDGTFADTQWLGVGDVQDVAVGDVTGDGVVDIVFSLQVGGVLGVVPGPAFDSNTTFGDTNGKSFLDLADVDGDGVLDVVVPVDTGPWALRVYQGGGFVLLHDFDLGSDSPDLVACADLDLDGDVDCAVSFLDQERIDVYPNVGGELQAASLVRIETGVYAFQIADLDLDGLPDFVIGEYTARALAWVRNLGSLTFSSPITLVSTGDDLDRYQLVALADGVICAALSGVEEVRTVEVLTVPAAPAAVALAAAEVTGAVEVGATPVTVALNWTAAESDVAVIEYEVEPLGWTTNETAIELALALGVEYSLAVRARNYRGTGPASAPALLLLPTARVEVVAETVSIDDGDDAFPLQGDASGDLDGDGVPDLVVVFWGVGTVVWFNVAQGSRHVLLEGINKPTAVAVGDVDADGDADVVVGGAAGLFLLRNPFTSAAAAETIVDAAAVNGVRVGDVTGDGVVDVVFSMREDNVVGYAIGPDFAAIVTANTTAGEPYLLDLADMDSDGVLDVVVPSLDGAVAWHTGANLALQASLPADSATMVRCADLDLDGDVDCVVTMQNTDTIAVIEHSWAAANLVELPGGGEAIAVDLGDVDLDGLPDIVVALFSGSVLWLRNAGLLQFDAPIVLLEASRSWGVALADFDLDGDLDVGVTVHSGSETVRVLTVQTVPFAVDGLAAAPLADGRVNVSWSAAGDNGALVTDYVVNGSSVGAQVWVALNVSTAYEVAAASWRGLGPAVVVEYDSCSDGVTNAGEVDVDCGFASGCGACSGGSVCSEDGDCLNGQCLVGGVCASCSDGLLNQDETSVDCGGWSCGPCLSCSGVDNGVDVSWAEVDGAEGYWVSGLVVVGDNATTVDGLPNYVPATVAVAALPGGVNGTCEATPLPDFAARVEATGNAGDEAVYGDVNSDGRLDMFLNSDLYLGTEEGLFVYETSVTESGRPALGDVDGDGDLDVIIGASSGEMHVYAGPDFSTLLLTSTSISLSGESDVSPSVSGSSVYVGTASGTAYVCALSMLENCTVIGGLTDVAALALCDDFGTVVAIDSAGAVTIDGVDAGVTATAGTTATCYADGVVALGAEQLLSLVAHPEPPSAFAVELLTLSTANFSWAPSEIDGSAAVTEYVVRGGAGGDQVPTIDRAVVLDGLEGGATYGLTVSAVNEVGESIPSTAFAFEMPAGNVTVTKTPVAGQAAVHWSLPVAYSSVRVGSWTGVAPPYVADGLNCSLHGFGVTFVDDASDELVGWGSMEVPPVGVCPGMCSASPSTGTKWIDPTLSDPVAVECDGNWTIGHYAVLGDLSSHTRLTYANGDVVVLQSTGYAPGGDIVEVALKTELRVAVEAQPPTIVGHAVNVSAEIVAAPNVAAAVLWVRLDGGAWTADVDLGVVEAEGLHELELMAVLDPWLTSPVVTVAWESDYTAPVVGFEPKPAAFEASTEAVFGLAASEGSVVFQYCLDGVTCGSQASTDLADDVVLPSTLVVGTAPENPVASPLALNVTTDVGTSFAVSTDGGAWAVTDLSSIALSDGWHSLQVRAVDSGGNADPSPLAFGLAVGGDRWAPDTFVSGGDGPYYVGSTVSLELSADEDGCTFEYSLDAGSSWLDVGGSLEFAADAIVAVHVFVRAIDAAGNVDPEPASVSWSVLPPETWFVNSSSAVAEGTGVAVEYSTDLGASWSASPVPAAVGVVFARAVDALGNVDLSPAIVSFAVAEDPRLEWALAPADQSPFAMAVFAVLEVETSGCALSWSLSSSAGAVGDDGVFVVGPLLLGLHSVEVSSDDCALSLVHTWEVTAESSALEVTFSGLAEGVHEVEAYATDAVDNVGLAKSYNWTVDVTAPETVLSEPASVVTTSSDLALNASCVDAWGCQFNVTVDGLFVGLLDTPLVVPGLAEGSHSIVVVAVDFAGNVAANSEGVTVYVDTTPPVVALEGANVTNAPSFNVSCSDLSGCVSLDLFVDGSSVGSLTGLTGLADGPHVASVEATDGASNVASASLAFVVDTTAPETVYAGAAALVVNSSSVELNTTCADESACRVESSVPLEGLADGVHVVELWAEDEAGNVDASPVVVNVTVDTVAPVVTYAGASQAGQSLTLALDCADLTRCEYHVSAPTALQVDGLVVTAVDGTHDVRVDVVDAAGNVGAPLLREAEVFDSTPPVLVITSQPNAYVAALTVEVEWTATDDNLSGCECDGVACTSPAAVTTSGEGAAGVQVVCSDIRDNSAAANVSWSVDFTSPEANIMTAVPKVTNESTWAIAFSVDDASPTTANCELSGLVAVSDDDCVSPFVVELGGDGTYAVNISATDAAQNVGPQDGVVFRLDTAVPVIEVTDRPDDSTTLQTVSIAFGCTKEDPNNVCGTRVEDTDCSLAYTQDGGPRLDSTTGVLDITAETVDEPTTVVLYATDEAGNVGVETVSWTWTDEAVGTTFTSGPPSPTNLKTFVFEWTTTQPLASPTAFEFKLDDLDWTEFTASAAADGVTYAANFTVADEGPHTLQVAVQGAADAADAWPWTVDHCALTGEIEYTSAAGELVCDDCPGGALCEVGQATVAPGYWWSQPPSADIREDTVLYRCRAEAACTGVWTEEAGLCAEGYEGVMCDTCSPGFGRNLELECQACGASDNSGIVALAATLFSLGLTVVAVFIVKRSLSTTSTVRAVSTLKIMANYFLMMGILKDLDLDWGGMLTKMFSYMGVASGAGAADVQLVNCVARVDTFDQFWLYFSIPVLLVAVPGVALWGYAGARRLKWVVDGRPGGSLGSARIWGHSKAFVYRQALLVLAYFAYPIIVTASFKALHCTDIEGVDRLVLDYSKECSGSGYAPVFAVGLLYATVLALGVPLGVYLAMRRHHSSLTTAGKAQTQFFFFFGEFRMERYWWEMTVMARKVAMGAIAVLLNNHAQKMQVYVGTWLLLFSFTAQITNQPHKDVVQRNLETVAQGTVLASLLLGQGMAFEDVTGGQRSAFQLCVLVLNVAVMNGMGLTLGWEVWKEAKGKLQLQKKAAAQGDDDDEAAGGLEMGTFVPTRRFSQQNPLVAEGGRGPGPGRGRGRARGRGRGRGRSGRGRGPGPSTPIGAA